MPRPQDTHRDFLVRLPVEMHQALKAKAAAEERTMSQAVRWVVARWLAEEDDSLSKTA